MENRAPKSAGAPPLREAKSDATVDFKVCVAKLEGTLCTVSGPVAGFDLCEESWVLGSGQILGENNGAGRTNLHRSKVVMVMWSHDVVG